MLNNSFHNELFDTTATFNNIKILNAVNNIKVIKPLLKKDIFQKPNLTEYFKWLLSCYEKHRPNHTRKMTLKNQEHSRPTV